MIGPFIVLGIFGLLLLFAGLLAPYNSGWDGPVAAVGVVLFVIGAFGTLITASIEADKNDCLKDMPVISQRETKWLDGQCYMKANNGKFVPQEWIEKGYEK